jgi:hypothetical protein
MGYSGQEKREERSWGIRGWKRGKKLGAGIELEMVLGARGETRERVAELGAREHERYGIGSSGRESKTSCENFVSHRG